MRPLRDLKGDTRGTAAIEFAFAITPLLLLVFGVFEYGRLVWTRNALQQVVAEGARCMGVLKPDCASGATYSASATTTHVRALARDRAITLTNGEVALQRPTTCAGVADFSRVTLTTTFRTAAPLLASLIAVPVSVTACYPNTR